jgi:hypothetical protein
VTAILPELLLLLLLLPLNCFNMVLRLYCSAGVFCEATRGIVVEKDCLSRLFYCFTYVLEPTAELLTLFNRLDEGYSFLKNASTVTPFTFYAFVVLGNRFYVAFDETLLQLFVERSTLL